MSITILIGQQLPNNFGEINPQQRQNLMTIPAHLTPIFALLTFIVPVLINLIELKFQKGSESVFQVHPATTMIAVVSLLTFIISLAVMLTLGIIYRPADVPPAAFAAVLHNTAVFSGSLSVFLGITIVAGCIAPFSLCPLRIAFSWILPEPSYGILSGVSPENHGKTSRYILRHARAHGWKPSNYKHTYQAYRVPRYKNCDIRVVHLTLSPDCLLLCCPAQVYD